ncbi:hypothetical protein FACS189485_17760 [Spirochaetia bacterium]|nr:hypothetical protein FACS189485_17760 [Spirochaetia bacterium]
MRNKIGFMYLLFVFTAIAVSCDINGIKIPNEAPFADIPSAESLDDGKIVSLKWQADPGSDSYILQKSIKGENDFGAFQEIYRGTDTVYIDRNIDINISYVYRLDKKRGNKIFEGTEYTIFNRTRPDPFFDTVSARGLSEGKKVLLTWGADTGADSYILQKSIADNDEFRGFKEIYSGLDTSYTDQDIDTSISYVYRLDKKRGNKIFEGRDYVVFNRTRPDPFAGLITAVSYNGGTAVHLSWDTDTGADVYIILRCTEKDYGSLGIDAFQEIWRGSETHHIDHDIDRGISYRYRLDKMRGNKLFPEENYTIYNRTRNDPFPAEVIAAKSADGKTVHLSWTSDEGADTYIILRCTEADYDAYGTAAFQEIWRGSETGHFDSINPRTGYYYRLDKEVVHGNETVKVKGANVKYLVRTRPDPLTTDVVSVQKSSDGNSVILTWALDKGADNYILMKCSESDYFTYGMGAFVSQIYSGSERTATDTVDPNTAWYYRLDKEVTDEGTTISFAGTKVASFAKIRPDPFAGVITADSQNGGRTAYLHWDFDAGADAYRIMRDIDDGVVLWEQVTEINDITVITFYDRGPFDNGLDDTKAYLYRLDKKRNGVWKNGINITKFSSTRPLPYDEAPRAESFNANGFITLFWDNDPGADEYILERRQDFPSGSGGVRIISLPNNGKDLTYVDRDVTAGPSLGQIGRYEYRLVKVRNGTQFRPDITTLAAAVTVEKEITEPNDHVEQAVLLGGNDITANLYYFRFDDGRKIEDVDWYKVWIPAHGRATIQINYAQGTIDSGSFDLVPRYGALGHPIVHGNPNDNAVVNPYSTDQYISFAIRPNDQFLSKYPNGGISAYTIYNLGTLP